MKITEFLISLLTLLIVSCNPNIKQISDIHEGEEIKIQLTAYSSEIELFAEADPFAAGKTSNILAHFSILPDFKPLDNGSVSLHLVTGQKEVIQTLEKPDRKGIYSFDITPSEPGVAKLIFEIFSSAGQFQIEVQSVEVFIDEIKADEAAENSEFSIANSVVFTKEQSWKIDFSTDLTSIGPFAKVIKTTALVQSALNDEFIVSAKAPGMVLFSEVNVLEGQSIAAGQTLFTISGAELAENNSSLLYSEARNHYLKLKAEYERHKELEIDKIISEEELINSKNEYDNAYALFEMLDKNFSSSGQAVFSPSSGFVKQLFVRNGEYLEAGQPVISIAKNKTLLLRAGVQQKYLSSLEGIKSATIKNPYSDKTYNLEELQGKVLSYGRNLDSDNYLIPVNIQIENNGAFNVGGFVELYLKIVTSPAVLTVPNTSLIEEQGIFFVFVQITPELFEKREVKVGSTDGLRSEVIQGLKVNDRIVTKGAIMIKLSQSSGALDPHAGHVH